jgi:hypothetical protein
MGAGRGGVHFSGRLPTPTKQARCPPPPPPGPRRTRRPCRGCPAAAAARGAWDSPMHPRVIIIMILPIMVARRGCGGDRGSQCPSR